MKVASAMFVCPIALPLRKKKSPHTLLKSWRKRPNKDEKVQV